MVIVWWKLTRRRWKREGPMSLLLLSVVWAMVVVVINGGSVSYWRRMRRWCRGDDVDGRRWGVELDDVHAGELLKEGDEDDHHPLLRPVLVSCGGESLTRGCLACLRGGDARCYDVTNLLQLGEVLAVAVVLNEGIKGVGEEARGNDEGQGGESGEAHAQAPPMAALNLGHEVADEIGEEDSDGVAEIPTS